MLPSVNAFFCCVATRWRFGDLVLYIFFLSGEILSNRQDKQIVVLIFLAKEKKMKMMSDRRRRALRQTRQRHLVSEMFSTGTNLAY